MPVNQFSIGRDITLDIVASDGPKRFGLITGWSAKQETTDIRVKGLDGNVRHMYLPDGWSGSLEFERQDAELEKFFASLEDAYYQGENLGTMTLTETISEPNGTVSQYRYEGCQMKLDDAGDWKGDASIKQRVSWMAARRKRIS